MAHQRALEHTACNAKYADVHIQDIASGINISTHIMITRSSLSQSAMRALVVCTYHSVVPWCVRTTAPLCTMVCTYHSTVTVIDSVFAISADSTDDGHVYIHNYSFYNSVAKSQDVHHGYALFLVAWMMKMSLESECVSGCLDAASVFL